MDFTTPTQRFKYQPDSLSYIPIEKGLKHFLRYNYLTILSLFLLGVICAYFFFKFIGTPEERSLRSQNRALEKSYTQLTDQFEVLQNKLTVIENRDDSLYRILLNQKPVDSQIREGGLGGHSALDKTEIYSEVVKSTAGKLAKLKGRLAIEENSLIKLTRIAGNNNQRMLHLPAIMPVRNENLRRTGAGFGMRFHPILKIYRMHEGIDFICPLGTAVYATANGKVSSARYSTTFGRVVEIDHGYGYTTVYAHLENIEVKTGQKLKRGEQIGTVGNSGLSAGNHLHYEVHFNNREIDPVNFFFNDLDATEYERIIDLANRSNTSLD